MSSVYCNFCRGENDVGSTHCSHSQCGIEYDGKERFELVRVIPTENKEKISNLSESTCLTWSNACAIRAMALLTGNTCRSVFDVLFRYGSSNLIREIKHEEQLDEEAMNVYGNVMGFKFVIWFYTSDTNAFVVQILGDLTSSVYFHVRYEKFGLTYSEINSMEDPFIDGNFHYEKSAEPLNIDDRPDIWGVQSFIAKVYSNELKSSRNALVNTEHKYEQESSTREISCYRCSYINQANSVNCEMCDFELLFTKKCIHCTADNDHDNVMCVVCNNMF